MKKLFAAVVVLAVLAAGAYAGYWYYLAKRVEPAVADWADSLWETGYSFAYGAIEVSGFPGRFRVHVADPVLTGTNGEDRWEWRSGAVEAQADPFAYGEITYRVADGGWLRYQGRRAVGPLDAVAETASGTIWLNTRGEPDRGDVSVAGLRITLPDGESALHAATARLEGRHTAASAPYAQDGSIDIALSLDGLDLPAENAGPLGPHVARFSAETRIAGTGAALAQLGNSRAAATAWRDGNGRLVVRSLLLDWGPLRLKTSGALSLDEQMRPRGSLETRIQGYRETAQALVDAGLVRSKDIIPALVVLDFMSKQPKEGGPRAVTLPLVAEGGRLSVGPVPIGKVPPLSFAD